MPDKIVKGPAPHRSGAMTIAAMVTMGIAGALTTIVIPGILAALTGPRGLTASQSAWLASAEMGGITAATVVISGWIAGLDRRRAAIAVLLLMVLANLGSYVAPGFAYLLGTRFVAGACGGVLLGIMGASVSMSAAPDRIFAAFLVGNQATSMVFFWVISLLSKAGHPDWVFLALVVVTIVPLFLLPWLPIPVAAARASGHARGARVAGPGILALFATFILLVGVGATWPLIGSLGLQRHLSADAITGILSRTTLFGITAGLLVYVLGERFGRRIPVIVGTLGIGLSILGLSQSSNALQFNVTVSALMFFWVGVTPFFSGVIAALDSTGRLAALFMAMQFGGLTVGPAVAGFIVPLSPAAPFWFGVGASLVAAVCITRAEQATRPALAG